MLFTGKFWTESSSFKICFPPRLQASFPLPLFSYCFSPLSPQTLTLSSISLSSQWLFSSFHWAMLLWHSLRLSVPAVPCGSRGQGSVHARCSAAPKLEAAGCGDWRGAMLPSRCHTERLTEAAKRNAEKWTQGEGPGGRSTRCWSLATQNAVQELAASASPTESSLGSTPARADASESIIQQEPQVMHMDTEVPETLP